MADMMLFPETWEEFEKQYMMIDKEQIYSNGTKYIPCFRVRQWMEHIENKKKHEANKMEQVAALFGKKLGEEFRIRRNYYISCSTVKARFMDKGFQILYDGCDYWTYNPERLSDLIIGGAVIIDEKTDDFTE